MDALDPAVVLEAIAGSDWALEDGRIVKEVERKDFADALAYVNAVGAKAEEANHHPDILIHGWNKVTLTLYTHTVGGVTEHDIAMARTLDGVT
jgi:4a-hydroxytetrahydrobiopterin dehydratase